MREIRFRGKGVDGKWWYGEMKPEGENHINLPTFFANLHAGGIKPETVGDYIGQKDKNSKEMYEGDISKITCVCGHTANLPVKSKDGYNGYYLDAKYQHNWSDDQLRLAWPEMHCEVIGNIYDNPELLEEG